MSEQLAKTPPIVALLASPKVKEELSFVLPPGLDLDTLISRAKLAVIANPQLLNCTPQSVLLAVKKSVATGLELDGRNAHLVPYGNTAQFIVDYKGYITLGERCGLKLIHPALVHDGDTFRVWSDDSGVHHVHSFDASKERGPIIGAFCLVINRQGIADVEYMTKREIDDVRACSRSGSGGPWKAHYGEMAKKTVVRRMSKRWDIDTRFKRALDDDDDRAELATPAKAKVVFPDEADPQLMDMPVPELALMENTEGGAE